MAGLVEGPRKNTRARRATDATAPAVFPILRWALAAVFDFERLDKFEAEQRFRWEGDVTVAG